MVPTYFVKRMVAVAVQCGLPLTGFPSPVIAQEVDSLALRAHVRFLASDLLEGRSNGSRGQHIAAEYIVAHFERLGLRALDKMPGYRQQIPLKRVRMERDSARLVLSGPNGAFVVEGTRFHHFAGDSSAFMPFEGPVRYIGALRRDVHDVTGAVVVAERAPGVPLDSASLAIEAAGARALIVFAPDSARYVALRHARGPHRYVVGAQTNSPADRRIPVIIADPGIRELLTGATTVSLRVTATFEPVVAWNIVASLPGTSPRLRHRPIIYSAHYDHIGYSKPVAGDSLYNGFMDNAVGVAAIMGIAEALRARRPAAPSVFLLTAVEEEGSFGAAYFAANPPFPLDSILAVINLDAGAPMAPPHDWYVEGGEQPSIARAIRSLRRAGIKITSAPLNPSSDHWPLYLRGVPAAFPVQGDRWGSMTEVELQASITRWWRQHRPDDEWDPEFPLSGLQSYAAFAIRLGAALSLP